MTQTYKALGQTTASMALSSSRAVSENVVGPLLAQRQIQNEIQMVVLDDQGAITGIASQESVVDTSVLCLRSTCSDVCKARRDGS